MKKKKIIKKKSKAKYLSMDKAIKMTEAIDENFETIDKDLKTVELDVDVAFKGLLRNWKKISRSNKDIKTLYSYGDKLEIGLTKLESRFWDLSSWMIIVGIMSLTSFIGMCLIIGSVT